MKDPPDFGPAVFFVFCALWKLPKNRSLTPVFGNKRRAYFVAGSAGVASAAAVFLAFFIFFIFFGATAAGSAVAVAVAGAGAGAGAAKTETANIEANSPAKSLDISVPFG
jgi:hypothetical protein